MLALLLALAGATRIGVWRLERANPAIGAYAVVNGTKVHFVHIAAGQTADLPPLVFIHGASANLKDQMVPFLPLLNGRAEMLFLDRPGLGWSARGPQENIDPDGQAKTIAALMDHVGIKSAIIIGHSYGGAVTASLAVAYPDKVQGLLFLSPAVLPWPGCGVAGYYTLTALPVIGSAFAQTISLPVGSGRLNSGSACVFYPNGMPETYTSDASIGLVLRPYNFRANAQSVKRLCNYVAKISPRYSEIQKPTVIISGDEDSVVLEEVHSKGLAKIIAGSELLWIHGVGHKSDYVLTDLAIQSLEKLSGKSRDLQAAARVAEAKVAAAPRSTALCSE